MPPRPRELARLGAFALCLAAAAASGPAAAKPLPTQQRASHPDGASIVLSAVDFRADSIVLSVTVANSGSNAVALNRGGRLLLDDGAHGTYRANPPADNPELKIPPAAALSGDLVFIGPLASAARGLTLSSNEGIGTPDNPHDDAPVLRLAVPLDGADPDRRAAVHPDATALSVRKVRRQGDNCAVSLLATNGGDRAVALNHDGSMTLSDARGASAPVRPIAGNPEMTLLPASRLGAELLFDCRALDPAAAVTLSTNRGTDGTPDNPFETVPVLSLALGVPRSSDGPLPAPQAQTAPIPRSRLTASSTSPTAAQPQTAPTPPEPPAKAAAPAPSAARAPAAPRPEPALHASRTEHGWRVMLAADALFAGTADTLADTADPLLSGVAGLIAAHRPREVVVAGHTDSAGSDDDKLALSQRRAHAVAAWLAAKIDKSPPRFVERGYGRTRPVAPNHKSDGSDNPEGRAKNRRIEILLNR